jgi:hypothetical protein
VKYFQGRGKAEPIRLMLHWCNMPYENEFVTFAQWPQMKPNTEFGCLPTFEVNGKDYA